MIFSYSYLAAFGIYLTLNAIALVGGLLFFRAWVRHSKALEAKLDEMFDEIHEGH